MQIDLRARPDDVPVVVQGPAATHLTGSREGWAPDARPRRRLRGARSTDVWALVGSAAGGVAGTWIVFSFLAPFSGALGWVLCSFVLSLVLYALVVSFDEDGQAVADRIVSVVVHALGLLLLTGLISVIVFVVARGIEAMKHANMWVRDLSTTGPLAPLTLGGILHGIVGTLQQITIALIITVPVGLTCAVFLNEFRGGFVRFVRTIVEAMTALPSIVAGLFVYTAWVLGFPALAQAPVVRDVAPLAWLVGGHGKSGLAASLALSVMMTPIIVRAADVVLRLVPGNLKEASYALGAGRWRTVWTVTLPTSRSGLATAIILGTARGIGETSPVLLTAGFTQGVNANPLSGPQVSLPLLAFELVKSPQPAMVARGFGAAATLLMLVVVLFVVARVIGGNGPGRLSPRAARRRARRSYDDAERIAARRLAHGPTLIGPIEASSTHAPALDPSPTGTSPTDPSPNGEPR